MKSPSEINVSEQHGKKRQWMVNTEAEGPWGAEAGQGSTVTWAARVLSKQKPQTGSLNGAQSRRVRRQQKRRGWTCHNTNSFRIFHSLLWFCTVKGFSIVSEVEVDVFMEFSSFSYYTVDVGNLISGSSAFSKTSLNIWKFTVYVLWSLAWRILSITLLACEMSAIVR